LIVRAATRPSPHAPPTMFLSFDIGSLGAEIIYIKKGFFMKLPLAVLILFAAFGAYSQTTSSQNSMDSQITRFLKQNPGQNLFITGSERPNEIKRNGISYSGIFVELMKTDNPLELINPAAPPEYGSSEDNTARDPITGRASGLKLFSISF
jgi:hypothetical protein